MITTISFDDRRTDLNEGKWCKFCILKLTDVPLRMCTCKDVMLSDGILFICKRGNSPKQQGCRFF